MVEYFTFSLIIDDVVLPNGRSHMNLLGGGGIQTAFGMRLWAEQVGLVASVGEDVPAGTFDWLAEMAIDTTGLHRSTEWPTLRAWQILENDGRRRHLWRTPLAAIRPQLARYFAWVPTDYHQAKGVHLGIHVEDVPDELAFLQALRGLGATLSLEVYQPAKRPLTDAALRQIATLPHILSPNEIEAASLVGEATPQETVRRLGDAGAEIVTLRMGAEGALVYRTETGEVWHIPALETAVVDPVGAGNAFCGAFLVGWVKTADLRLAGQYGCVAGSFLVEQIGVPAPRPALAAEAQQRLARLQMG
ncbi:MAG: PfkB family carbohydrate kinase [Chloroflexota bacterium]